MTGLTTLYNSTVENDLMDLDSSKPEVEKLDPVVLNKVPTEILTCSGVNDDAMNVDISPVDMSKQSQLVIKDNERKKPLKRKRAGVDTSVLNMDKESLASNLQGELNDLLEYYKEFTGYNLSFEENPRSSNNSLIACLVEESNLPFSKLVDEVYKKMKTKEGVTLASVRSSVLSVAQRMMYGITNADADVLEDDSELCLWCWEVRDMKLLHRSHRGTLNMRRVGRKKIHERISALSATLSALSAAESGDSYKADLNKASKKLRKTLNREGIVSMLDRLKKKNEAEMSEKEHKLKEKAAIHDKERTMQNAEKGNQQIEQDIQKEKLQSEKEIKRLQDESVKEEKRREKEELEMKKQLKKQQDEAERDQKRREKEELELKKQLKKQQEEAEKEQKRREKDEAEKKRQVAVQKQASIMQRFLLKSKTPDAKLEDVHKETSPESKHGSACKEKDVVNATTSTMDCIFSKQLNLANEDFRSLHLASWHKLSRVNRSCRWGIRRKPKTGLFPEIKLQQSSEMEATGIDTTPEKGVTSAGKSSPDKFVDGMEESSQNLPVQTSSKRMLKKKLLQFDKSNRPAYYGVLQSKSCVIGPRRPFNKDPYLDYECDSDEEWEEENTEECLSEKDNDDESLELEDKCSDDEDDDGFVVPDGHLSDNEGIHIDDSASETEDEGSNLPKCTPEVDCKYIKVLQRQKHLRNFTDQALRKGHPLIISNLMHEKSAMVIGEDLEGANKVEQICLQALCMQMCAEGTVIDISVDQNTPSKNPDVVQIQAENVVTPTATEATMSDSDLTEFVSVIRSNPSGIDKLVESLKPKFPNLPKTRIRSKIREISDFVDNRWQVKKEILAQLGLSTSPGTSKKPKSIASYFTKRCLPPEGKDIASTSQPSSKVETPINKSDDALQMDI